MLLRSQKWDKFLGALIFFISSYTSIVYSQSALCNGNLGANIFTEGDFGSGVATIYPVNPGLAPGFIYTIQVPPDDGEYTLTNDMSKWLSSFPTWLQIGDNSSDPNGYMMVVNASFTSGIFYEQVIDNICANTFYEFSADVINIIKSGTSGHILPNVSFLIDGNEVYTTGEILQDEKWHTYGFTFTTGTGQSSVKLSLRNNAPGGIGNDLALDNIRFRPCGPNASISIEPDGKICENSLFPVLTAQIGADTGALQWQVSFDNGLSYTDIDNATERYYQINELSAGIYFFRYLYGSSLSNLGNSQCRIISYSIMVEIVPVEFMIRDTLCEGQTFNLGGVEYGETGIYQQQLVASNGCDSIVTLDLLVFPDPPIVADFVFTPTSCEGAEDGTISIASVTGTRPPFIFLINDSIIPPPSTSVKLPAGVYFASVENEYGCFDAEEIIVPDGPPLEINTIDDLTVILGHSVFFETSSNLPISKAIWNPPAGLNCAFCISTLATPFEDQTYVITAETEQGCIDMDSIKVRVDRDPVLYIPNVFSPNNDQVNDFFEISSDPLNVTSIDLALVFDRWGGILSEKANLFNEGQLILWDGMTPAGPANPGTYVYLIKFTLADGSLHSVSGDVSIVK